MTNRQKGFTFIELLTVVSITGLLAVFAVPTYINYLVQAQIAEGLNMSLDVKVAASDYYLEHGEWPKDNQAAGLAEKREFQGEYTEHVEIKNNIIEIRFSMQANAAIAEKKVKLIAEDSYGSIVWICQSPGDIKRNQVPATCR